MRRLPMCILLLERKCGDRVVSLTEIYEHLISIAPTSYPFSRLRYSYYKPRLKQSQRFFSSTGFHVQAPGHVSIGRNCYFNRNVILAAIPDDDSSQIIIGDNCNFGPNVVISAADHPLHDLSKTMRENDSIGGKVIIGDGCWIGANSTITRNVTIGKESVIGANSVVTHDIPEYSIAVGCPARGIWSRI